MVQYQDKYLKIRILYTKKLMIHKSEKCTFKERSIA